MGQFNSAEEKDQYGFNIVAVQPQSPGQRAGLMSYYDFVMTANGIPLRDMNKEEMQDFIASLEGQAVKLKVYHRERAQLRTVMIYPSRDWPGSGLLGISVKLQQYTNDSVIEKLPSGENRRCSVNLSYDEIFRTIDAPQNILDEPASPIGKEKKPMSVRIAHKIQKMTLGRSNSDRARKDMTSRSLDSSDLPSTTNPSGMFATSSRDSFEESNTDNGISTHASSDTNSSGAVAAVSIRDSMTGARVQQEASPMRVMRAGSADGASSRRSNLNRPLPSVPETRKVEVNSIECDHTDGIAMRGELEAVDDDDSAPSSILCAGTAGKENVSEGTSCAAEDTAVND